MHIVKRILYFCRDHPILFFVAAYSLIGVTFIGAGYTSLNYVKPLLKEEANIFFSIAALSLPIIPLFYLVSALFFEFYFSFFLILLGLRERGDPNNRPYLQRLIKKFEKY
jgi:hypothetical protein